MKNNWYVYKHKNGVKVGVTPHAMSRSEADNLAKLLKMTQLNMSFM